MRGWLSLDAAIWHRAHVRTGASIGSECVIGGTAYIDEGVTIGDRVKIQSGALDGSYFSSPPAVALRHYLTDPSAKPYLYSTPINQLEGFAIPGRRIPDEDVEPAHRLQPSQELPAQDDVAVVGIGDIDECRGQR